jgi:uncharacterized coiled-coil protein SlyX
MALPAPRVGKYPFLGVVVVPPTPKKPARYKASVAGYGGAIYLGIFDTPVEAALAVDKAKWLLLHHENRLALALSNPRTWNDYETAVTYSEESIKSTLSMFVAERILKIALDRDHHRNQKRKTTGSTPTARLNQLELTYRETIDQLAARIASLESALADIQPQLARVHARLFATQSAPQPTVANPSDVP